MAMSIYIRRPRQVIGLIYILLYIITFITYAFILGGDQSWFIVPKFTIAVMVWFILSLAVKISMFMNRMFELLNLGALVAALSIAFIYVPQPGAFSSIESFCYYLHLIGGSACDFFDFLYESGTKPSEESS